jgi:hypothetical protein
MVPDCQCALASRIMLSSMKCPGFGFSVWRRLMRSGLAPDQRGKSEPRVIITISHDRWTSQNTGRGNFCPCVPPVAAFSGHFWGSQVRELAARPTLAVPPASCDDPFVFLTERGSFFSHPYLFVLDRPRRPVLLDSRSLAFEEGARSAHSFLFLVAHLAYTFFVEFYHFLPRAVSYFPGNPIAVLLAS